MTPKRSAAQIEERRVADEFTRGWNEAIAAAEAIAIKWRDENRTACIKARKSSSEASQDMADLLNGAAIECNAIAGAIRQLAKANSANPIGG